MHHRARTRVTNPKGRGTRTFRSQTRRWGLKDCHPRPARNSSLGLRVASHLTHFVSGSAWSENTKLRWEELNDPRIPRRITRGWDEKHILRCAPAPPPQRSFRVFHLFVNASYLGPRPWWSQPARYNDASHGPGIYRRAANAPLPRARTGILSPVAALGRGMRKRNFLATT